MSFEIKGKEFVLKIHPSNFFALLSSRQKANEYCADERLSTCSRVSSHFLLLIGEEVPR